MTRERVLTERELNRALLARQLLLERASLPLPRVLERVGGIQAQYAPSSYVGLWSRVAGFERAHLTEALERRRVVQGALMRSTIHLVSARDYSLLAAGVRQPRRDWWLRAQPGADERAVAAAARKARALLADGPLRQRELAQRLRVDTWMFNGLGLWLDLVRAPPSGTWEQRRADLYALADDWLGGSQAAADEGLELPERFRPRVFDTKTPHSVTTFLVDGRVAGTWKEERTRVRLDPFEPLPREVRRELADEAERLGAFLA